MHFKARKSNQGRAEVALPKNPTASIVDEIEADLRTADVVAVVVSIHARGGIHRPETLVQYATFRCSSSEIPVSDHTGTFRQEFNDYVRSKAGRYRLGAPHWSYDKFLNDRVDQTKQHMSKFLERNPDFPHIPHVILSKHGFDDVISYAPYLDVARTSDMTRMMRDFQVPSREDRRLRWQAPSENLYRVHPKRQASSLPGGGAQPVSETEMSHRAAPISLEYGPSNTQNSNRFTAGQGQHFDPTMAGRGQGIPQVAVPGGDSGVWTHTGSATGIYASSSSQAPPSFEADQTSGESSSRCQEQVRRFADEGVLYPVSEHDPLSPVPAGDPDQVSLRSDLGEDWPADTRI